MESHAAKTFIFIAEGCGWPKKADGWKKEDTKGEKAKGLNLILYSFIYST